MALFLCRKGQNMKDLQMHVTINQELGKLEDLLAARSRAKLEQGETDLAAILLQNSCLVSEVISLYNFYLV